MNILFLSTNYPYPVDSGHNIRTFNTLKYLSKENNIFYLAFSKKRDDVNKIDPIKKMCKSVDIFFIPDDFNKLRMLLSLFQNLFSFYPYIANKYYRKNMKKRLNEIIQNNKIDIIHFDLLHLSRYLDNSIEIPYTLTEHNVESSRLLTILNNNKNYFFKIYMYLQYKKLMKFETENCPKYETCISVSTEDAETLRKMCPDSNLTIIPNGVDIDYFKPCLDKPLSNGMAWVGGMGDIYNKEAVNYFCKKIFPVIKDKINDVKFTVIGKNPTKEVLKLSSNNVNCVGYVDDIRPYIHRATIFVAPIISGGGTKLKVLNALSMGKAVVTTSVGAEGIEVTNYENIIIEDEPEKFARKVIELLNSPRQVQEIGKKARELILDKYDWNKIGKKHNRLYLKIVDKYNMK